MVYTRKDVGDLSKAERRRFINAVLELKRSGEYDEFVRVHIDYYVADGEDRLRLAHMAPSFLPWHRKFLLEFERALRAIDSSVTVPYWDWTRDRTADSTLWRDDFMGGTGRRGDRRVMSGPFAHAEGRWRVRYAMTDGDFLTRNLGRPDDPLSLPTRRQVDRVMRQTVYDVAPWNSTSRSGFRNRLEGWGAGEGDDRFLIHNRVHRWVGGHMLGGASVNDPVFWLNHSYVDLLWSRWQRHHPRAGYLPSTPPPPGDPQHERVAAREQPMGPWGVTPAQMLSHARIYRYR
ncbi:tyrosinase family protein [Streptomyces sp. B-S-A8]|uniref:Tyrosinase family protein n=1 Tax=Streptomyces solicavernae TaxID=3043614 RepID=A0ABT6RXR1_9ACTN|nr:tyrosinase family protein [Streptomyces sp. B-S-A8]MDI3388466.1 tyrosinase family protein [Streptomyces sp. B-S-A8]